MTNQEKGLEFEKRCFSKLVDLNFTDLSLTRNTDNGADIIGTLNGTKYVFQCKNHKKSQGNRCVQEVIAAQKLYKGNRCVVISHSSFTSAAIALAKANNCILIKANEFFELSDFPPKNYSVQFDQNTPVYDFDYQLIEKYFGTYRSSYYVRRWGSIDNFLLEIGRTRTSAGLPRRYTNDEVIAIYSLIKILLSLVKEIDNYEINQTVLEQLRFNSGTLISPATFSNKFGDWKAFCTYLEENNINNELLKIVRRIRCEGIQVLFTDTVPS